MKDHSLSEAFELATFSIPEVKRFLNSPKSNGRIVPEAEGQNFPGSVAPYSLSMASSQTGPPCTCNFSAERFHAITRLE